MVFLTGMIGGWFAGRLYGRSDAETRRPRRWIGFAVGIPLLTTAGLPPAGFAEQTFGPVPEIIEGVSGPGFPESGIWVDIGDSEQLAQHRTPVINDSDAAPEPIKSSPAWLNSHVGQLRIMNREPDLWRYEF